MKFEIDAITEDQGTYLHTVECHASHMIQQQQKDGLFLPLIISGNTGSGKDTIAEAMKDIFENLLNIPFGHTESRYTTRPNRDGEENSPLNFVSDDKFQEKNLGFIYEYAGNKYGLDHDLLKEELKASNRIIINGNPEELGHLHGNIAVAHNKKYLPAIIYNQISQEDNLRLLLKRGGTEEEISARIKKIMETDSYNIDWLEKPIFSSSCYVLDRKPSISHDENQMHFNENVLTAVGFTCNYINATILKWRHAPANNILS